MNSNEAFHELLKLVPDDHKSQGMVSYSRRPHHRHVYLGAPPQQGRVTLEDRLPADLAGVSFLGVDGQPELLEAFVQSGYAEQITDLVVGNSTYALCGAATDSTQTVAVLGNASLPALEHLALGEWELFHNAEPLYGTLGDVTEVLGAVSHIETLGLYGSFELSHPLHFENLEELEVWSLSSVTAPGDVGIPVGSLRALFSSEMPQLRELVLHPCCDVEGSRDALPPAFLEGRSVPRLERLEVTLEGCPTHVLECLLDGPLLRRAGLHAVIEGLEQLDDLKPLRRQILETTDLDWSAPDTILISNRG